MDYNRIDQGTIKKINTGSTRIDYIRIPQTKIEYNRTESNRI